MEILLIGLVLTILVLGFLLYKQGRSSSAVPASNELLLMQQQLQELSRTLDERLEKSSSAVQESVHKQLSSSQNLIREITREIAEVKETNKQVFGFTESLSNLEKVLRNQKQRGSLGEEGLKLILENMLGVGSELYELQYRFSSGEIVDAVVKAKDGIICIDSKFSLDNYQRLVSADSEAARTQLETEFKKDLKKRIDETAKYIRPTEGTLSFALMYIPAEGIYYDLIINQTGTGVNTRSLVEYANEKNVVIVSPMTLYAYLQTILHGFNAFKIEKQTEAIQKNVARLKKHLSEYDRQHRLLGDNLSKTVGNYNKSRKAFSLVDKDVLRITGESAEIEPLEIERPNTDEN